MGAARKILTPFTEGGGPIPPSGPSPYFGVGTASAGLFLFDTTTHDTVTISSTTGGRDCRYSYYKERFIGVNSNNTARIYDTSDYNIFNDYNLGSTIIGCAISPDLSVFAVKFSTAPYVKVSEYSSGTDVPINFTATNPSTTNLDLDFSPDGTLLAVAHTSGIQIVSTSTWEEVVLLTVSGGGTYKVRFSQDGQYVGGGSRTSLPKVFKVSDWSEVTLPTLPTSSRCLAFSPDGQWLAFGANSGGVRIVRLSDWQIETTLTLTNNFNLNGVSFSRDSSRIACGILANNVSSYNEWEVATWVRDVTKDTQLLNNVDAA